MSSALHEAGAAATHRTVTESFGELRAIALRVMAERDELLALAKQYASECGFCDGSGTVTVTIGGDGSGDHCAALMDCETPCEACADIRSVIAKVKAP